MIRHLAWLILLCVSCTHVPVDRGFLSDYCGILRWGRPGLIVQLEPDVDTDMKQTIDNAIEYWNARSVVYFVDMDEVPPDFADILISRTNSSSHGETSLHWDSDCIVSRAEISLPGLATPSILDKITRHEFGHALGLDHDDLESSIMNEWVGAQRMDATPLDIELLSLVH